VKLASAPMSTEDSTKAVAAKEANVTGV